jgi:nondiscriminating aspartyl-tRNA synthetase
MVGTMQHRILIENMKSNLDNEITIAGWIHSIRKQGKIAFVLLRDRTGIAQIATESTTVKAHDLRNETVIIASGKIIEDKRAETGIEMKLADVKVLSRPVKPLPIIINDKADFQKLELETLLNNRVLSLRNPRRNLIFKLQAEIIDSYRTFFKDHGFTEVSTPKIIVSGTEGGTQLFSVDYFDKVAYLAQSPQFYKQMLVGSGYERVFEIGHVYRAEEHNTSRHLNEYISLDYEMGFIENEHDVMDVEELFIMYLFKTINENSADILDQYNQTLDIPEKIPRLPVRDACRVLEEEYGKKLYSYDLDPEGEKLICEWAKKNYKTELLFLTEYPRSKRPVYTMPMEDNPEFTRSFDLIFRGIEITTGGQRIHDYSMLVEAFKGCGLNPSDFDYYIDTFAYGMPPHGGLAIGLERITAQILGLGNIREASLFPRDRNRIIP